MSIARQLIATGLVGLLAATALIGAGASAQQIYRIVGPDGRVTYSDQAPPQGAPTGKTAASAETAATPRSPGGGETSSALPFDLRQTASRYPVTLYTGPNCEPCASGRAMLAGRGIPFTEKTITNTLDLETFKRLYDATSVPLLTVGGQQIKGYSDAEWGRYLDAAGYPKTSLLPPGYRPGPATPLVALQPAPATPVETGSAQAQAPAAAPAPPATPATNPAGIRF